jgi:ankyrin repeat protein
MINDDITMDIYEYCCMGNVTEVKRLLASGFDVNRKHSRHGMALLHLASRYGYLEIVIELLKCGADINVCVSGLKRTPLRLAVEYNKPEVVRELLKYGTEGGFIDPNERSYSGWTLLHLAVRAPNPEGMLWDSQSAKANRMDMVRILLEYCDPTLIDDDGKTATDCTNNREIKQLITDAIEFYKNPDLKEPDCE